MAIHHRRYSGHPHGARPWPYKSHPDDPRSTPHLTEPFSSPLPRRNPSPPSSHDLFAPPPSPSHHAAAPSSGEARAELPVPPSPFCAPAGELCLTGAAGGRAPVSVPPCPLSVPASVHSGPSAPGQSTKTWTRSMNYPLGNNSLIQIFQKSCKEAPGLLGNQPAVQILPILHSGPRVFPKLTRGPGFLQLGLKFEKYLQKGP
jgi:hypothetical protein